MSSSSPFAEIHDELRAVARDLLGGSSPVSSGEGSTVAVDWAKIAQAGWTGLEIAEDLGGAGATIAEVGVVLQEMGRAVTASPYLGTVVLGAGLLSGLEPSTGRDDLLRSIAEGTTCAAVAVPSGEEDVRVDRPPFTHDDAGVVEGAVDAVIDAVGADVVLLPAVDASGELVVAAVPAGVEGLEITPVPVVDETRKLGRVIASGVLANESVLLRPAAGTVVGGGPSAEPLASLYARAAFALAADSLGLAEAMLDTTVSYVALREQFGRPIGSFQAVKHACADMLIQIRVGHELLELAETALAAGDDDAWIAASQAKSQICAAAVDVAGKAMQLHGGIGYTWESGVHAYLKRTALNRSLFGSSGAHRKRLATRYR